MVTLTSVPLPPRERKQTSSMRSRLFFVQLYGAARQPVGFRRLWLVVGALVICGFASGAIGAESTKPAAEASKVAAPKEATLVVWKQAITVFRASFGGLDQQERAAQAAERIQALPLGSESAEIKVEPVKIGAEEGVVFNINSSPLFFLTTGDIATDSNQALNAEAQAAVTALRAALRARVDQRQWSNLLMRIGFVLIATLLLLGLMWLWRRVKIWLLKGLGATARLPRNTCAFLPWTCACISFKGAGLRFVLSPPLWFWCSAIGGWSIPWSNSRTLRRWERSSEDFCFSCSWISAAARWRLSQGWSPWRSSS